MFEFPEETAVHINLVEIIIRESKIILSTYRLKPWGYVEIHIEQLLRSGAFSLVQ